MRVLTDPDDEDVHEAVDVRSLELRGAAVHHQLRVLAGEHHQTVAPLGVAQHTTCPTNTHIQTIAPNIF